MQQTCFDSETLTAEEIIKILKESQTMLEIIQKKMDTAFKNVETLDETIQRLSIKAVRYDTSDGVGQGFQNNMITLLEQRDQDQKRQMELVQRELNELVHEEAKIYHVLRCMRALPADLYKLTYALYVQGETWDYYAAKNRISKSAVSRKKREAIEQIQTLYQAEVQDTVFWANDN